MAVPSPAEAPIEEPTEAVGAAEDLKVAVSDQSETVGSMVSSLDAMAVEVGNMRISLWDGLVVIGVIFFVIALAWLATRLDKRRPRRSKSCVRRVLHSRKWLPS